MKALYFLFLAIIGYCTLTLLMGEGPWLNTLASLDRKVVSGWLGGAFIVVTVVVFYDAIVRIIEIIEGIIMAAWGWCWENRRAVTLWVLGMAWLLCPSTAHAATTTPTTTPIVLVTCVVTFLAALGTLAVMQLQAQGLWAQAWLATYDRRPENTATDRYPRCVRSLINKWSSGSTTQIIARGENDLVVFGKSPVEGDLGLATRALLTCCPMERAVINSVLTKLSQSPWLDISLAIETWGFYGEKVEARQYDAMAWAAADAWVQAPRAGLVFTAFAITLAMGLTYGALGVLGALGAMVPMTRLTVRATMHGAYVVVREER